MKKIFTIILFACSLLSATNIKAQFVLHLADEQYNLYNYYNAADLYEQAYKKKPTLHAAEQLANSYRLMHDYKNEESWYAIAVTMPNSKPENVLNYARALQSNSKYSEAKAQYIKYAALNSQLDKNRLNIWLASCDSAVKWMQNPTQIIVKNEQALNSPTSDWGASEYKNSIVFASDRFDKADEKPETKGRPFLKFDGNKGPGNEVYGWTGNGYLKLYSVNKLTTQKDSVNMFPLSTQSDYHVGPAVFTPDENEMYFTVTRKAKDLKTKGWAKTVRLEIYSSKKDQATNKWSTPISFKYNNVEKWSVGDPFITADGNKLFFASDMPGGKGGTDIYYCLKDNSGNWGQPVNLAVLNTPGDERTPVIDSARNIYYASDGGITMGGLDVLRAAFNGTSYGTPQNLGYPVNSPQDDFAYIVKTDNSGYLSSNRVGGLGSDDIYSFKNKPVINLRLEGIVYDKNTHETLMNSIVTLTKVNGTALKVQTDATGGYKFGLEQQSDYDLLGEKTNYRSDNQNFSTVGLTTSQVLKKDLFLEKNKIDSPIVLKNIHYDFDKSNIRADAKIELNKLIKVLRDNPTIWIELSSHTDSRGSDAYNMALSQRRANSAVSYIIDIGGINKNRITARGYGETQLLNRCANGVQCSEAEHQVNRRTEFKIVKQ